MCNLDFVKRNPLRDSGIDLTATNATTSYCYSFPRNYQLLGNAAMKAERVDVGVIRVYETGLPPRPELNANELNHASRNE